MRDVPSKRLPSPAIAVPREEVASFCRRHRIRKLALFGSVLRTDFGPGSDVDILAEFEPGVRIGFVGLGLLEDELSALLGGRRVDLRSPEDLSRHFRDEVVSGAEVVFAQAG